MARSDVQIHTQSDRKMTLAGFRTGVFAKDGGSRSVFGMTQLRSGTGTLSLSASGLRNLTNQKFYDWFCCLKT